MADAVPRTESPKSKKPGKGTLYGIVAGGISLLGFGGLCFLSGAALMHSGSTAAKPLAQGFQGAGAWFGQAGPPRPRERINPGVSISEEGAFDGLTLVTTTEGAEAHLYDRTGRAAHRWKMPTCKIGNTVSTAMGWERCRVYPNGDLVALCTLKGNTPYGLGVVKVDLNSKLLWQREGKFHHDFDVGEDGRIHLLEMVPISRPPPGFEKLPQGCIGERIVTLSPAGEVEQSLSLLETIRGTPFQESFLFPIRSQEMLPGPMPGPGGGAPFFLGDPFHANSIHVLPKALARRFPLFKAGQFLLSLRSPNLLVVLDPEKRSVVWTGKGPWLAQHDAQFLDNGRILLFDNLGNPDGSRVLEYDPVTQGIPWQYGGTEGTVFHAQMRGRCQRLPNGNTRIVEPLRRIFEIADGKIIWQFGFGSEHEEPTRNFTCATVHARHELPFLK